MKSSGVILCLAMSLMILPSVNAEVVFELAADNIRVNSVGPTWVDTPMTRPALENPALRKDVLDSIPMGHLAQIEDVVGAVRSATDAAAEVAEDLIESGRTAFGSAAGAAADAIDPPDTVADAASSLGDDVVGSVNKAIDRATDGMENSASN